VVGPRQAGKSTLVKEIVAKTADASYVSLDDLETRTAATADPRGFVENRPGMLAIDEVQRVPELLLAIKASVDIDERPGRFLVTGSSQLSATRGVSETLAGRIERFELWPLAQSELIGTTGGFLDRLLTGQLPDSDPERQESQMPHNHGLSAPQVPGSLSRTDYLELAARGGYPEALRRPARRRAAWFDAYVDTVVEREAPGVSASPRTAELPRLLRLVAARHAGLLNVANLARDAALPERTVHRYLELLEAVFLVRRCPAWAANLNQREVRSAKIFVTDPGLAAHLRGVDAAALAQPETAGGSAGPVVEGLVFAELSRQSGWSDRRPSLFHYRDRAGAEIDVLVEDRSGRVGGVEVKASTSFSQRDVRHLATFRDKLGSRFTAGVLLYAGTRVLPLGDRLVAAPISAIWSD
jgi:predicted AAA+ superfamily ATPase